MTRSCSVAPLPEFKWSFINLRLRKNEKDFLTRIAYERNMAVCAYLRELIQRKMLLEEYSDISIRDSFGSKTSVIYDGVSY